MSSITSLDRNAAMGSTRLYYFTTANHLLGNLKDGKVKVSDFEKCNDLFELASVDLRDVNRRKIHRCWSKEVSKTHGLICFSRSWRHPLMWAHYAKSGSGACLILDVGNEFLCEVSYVSKRTKRVAHFNFPRPSDPEFRNFCSTKANFWAYEKEVRFFVNYSDFGIDTQKSLKFVELRDAVKLVGVINGPRAEISMNDILSVCRPEIFFQCRPAFTEFSIVEQQKKALWKK